MMILLRLWLILSLSVAAPLNPNVNNEVTEDIPSVVNGDAVVSDGIHNHTSLNTSPNTNRDPKRVVYGGDINFSGTIDSTGNHAHINIGSISSKRVSQEPHTEHNASEDPDVYRVCSVDAVNTDACFCKNGQGGGQDCNAEQGCTADGVCLDVCTAGKANQACFCDNGQEGGQDCAAEQVCTSGGACLDVPCTFDDTDLSVTVSCSPTSVGCSPHNLNSLYGWEKNTIPYYFTSTSDGDKQFFRSVMKIIEDKTCFIFKEATNAECGNEKHCLEIETGSESCTNGCNGFVTNPDDSMQLKLFSSTQVSDSKTFKLQCQGFILHELMHVLGVAHTFTRSDRDDFISLNEPNIHSLKVEGLLKKCENCRLYPEIPYDCDSIMHYGTHLNDIELMIPKDAETCSLKKQSKLFDGPNLSRGDEKILNIIGKCPGIFNTKYIQAIQIMGNELSKLSEENEDLNLVSNEQKLEGSMSDLLSYLQDECGDDKGSCDLEKIVNLIKESVSTIEEIKETGKVSPGFLQTFESKKKILVEEAEKELKKWLPTDCRENAVNAEACICKGDGGEAPCHAGEKCSDNGTCLRVCTSGEINYGDCFCKSHNTQSGEDCIGNQGCTHNGNCLNVCKPYPEEELSDCLCENQWKETKPCTNGQVCKYGECLNDEDNTRDPEFCKAVDCSLTGSEEFCPITCDQRQPAFCKVVDCSKPRSQEFCPIKCAPDCSVSKYNSFKILEADCVCKSKKGPEPCRKGKSCTEQGCMEEMHPFVFLLFIG